MMKLDQAFAAELHRDLMQEVDVNRYLSADESKIKHDRSRAVVAFVKGLSNAQREALQELVTQEQVNAVASVFSVIQGVRLLDGFDEDEFRLTY